MPAEEKAIVDLLNNDDQFQVNELYFKNGLISVHKIPDCIKAVIKNLQLYPVCESAISYHYYTLFFAGYFISFY